MVKRKLAALEKVDANLTNLQYRIKRDPRSYEKEFRAQYGQYENQRDIFLHAPGTASDAVVIPLRDLVDFISHVAECYPFHTKGFPEDLLHIVSSYHQVLEAELREKIIGSLVLLRRKNSIESSRLFDTLFPILVSTHSKTLRALIFQKILSDLRNSNTGTKDHRLNRSVQKILYHHVTGDRSSVKAIWAVKLTRQLWKRQIWTDSNAVEIMKEAALADNGKVIIGGVQFFLGGDREREDMQDESSDEEVTDLAKIKHQMAINKKNKKKARMLDNAVATVQRRERKKNQPHPLNFSAFHILHDPQGFAEELFQKHLQSSRSKLNIEQRLLVLQLVTRLVGLHKLTIVTLYSYFLKYLTPRQPSVTSFLASLAQATHDLVPPDLLEPLVQKIANEFVSEAAAAEVASAGLNAIREICVRQPLAMNETLLQDLVLYRKSKDKGVMMAAKGLLGLYRDVGPDMLRKRDRGKDAAMGLRSGKRKELRFGEQKAGEIEGLGLLEQWKEEERKRADPEDSAATIEARGLRAGALPDADVEDGWEVDEADSDDSGGWINVESDKDIELSDDDDGGSKPAVKRLKPNQVEGSHDVNDRDEGSQNSESESTTPANLATTRILTPADLIKLKELRLSASVNENLPASQRKRMSLAIANLQARHTEDPLTAAEIEGLASLSSKATKAEKVARAKEGQDDRSEHKSTQALRKAKKEAQGKSTTNKEKARRKNFLMTLGKGKAKSKRSLVEKRKVLKAHAERGKKSGRRGNQGR